MEKEVLFRGKTLGLGMYEWAWVYGHLTVNVYNGERRYCIHEPGDGFLCGGVYDVLYHTIGQYIGVEDKRGVKVFEGDILCFTKTDKESSTVFYGEVVFLQDRLMYAVNFDGEHVSFDEIIKKARAGSVSYVVIGSIYEEEYNDLTVKRK